MLLVLDGNNLTIKGVPNYGDHASIIGSKVIYRSSQQGIIIESSIEYDKNLGKAIVDTDLYGVYKFYFYRLGDKVLIGDDFLELSSQCGNLTLNLNAIEYFLINGFTDYEDTFYNEISKIPPNSLSYFTGDESQHSWKKIEDETSKKSFRTILASSISLIDQKALLFLTGGIDSTALYCLRNDKWNFAVGQVVGIKKLHERVTDNELDIYWANQLTGNNVSTLTDDWSNKNLSADLEILVKFLGTESALAFGYLEYYRKVRELGYNVVVNGQNADSILSFGSQGYLRYSFQRGIIGLRGVYKRMALYEMFPRIQKLLRLLYSRTKKIRHRPIELSVACGVYLNPERVYLEDMETSPSLELIEYSRTKVLRIQEYTRARNGFDLNLAVHHLAYMQGSANRSTVLGAALSGLKIILPYTSREIYSWIKNRRNGMFRVLVGKLENYKILMRGGQCKIILRDDPAPSDTTNDVIAHISNLGEFSKKMEDAKSKFLEKPGLKDLTKSSPIISKEVSRDSFTFNFRVLWLMRVLDDKT